jgi:hypothetical protein
MAKARQGQFWLTWIATSLRTVRINAGVGSKVGCQRRQGPCGIRLNGWDERSLMISSSDNTPFKIDLTMDRSEIQEMMQFHTGV